jgi:hypothetical protein
LSWRSFYSLIGNRFRPSETLARSLKLEATPGRMLEYRKSRVNPPDRHPRFAFHFTPTSCSWLNAVEGFFAKLAKQRLKRGVFRCVVELQAAINRFVAETNDNPKPFCWTADPDKIIAAIRRGEDYRGKPLIERKQRLFKLLRRAYGGLEYVEHLEGNGAVVFEHACKLGLEGIVCKRIDLPYRAGPSKSWIKVKNNSHPAMLRVKEAFEQERKRRQW